MAIGAVALVITLPGRAEVRAVRAARVSVVPAEVGVTVPLPEGLSLELEKQLEALLTAAEAGKLQVDQQKSVSASSLHDLLTRLAQLLNDPDALKQLARAMDTKAAKPSAPDAMKMQMLGERVKNAAGMEALPPEARDSLMDLAKGLSDAAQAEEAANAAESQEAAAAKAAQQANASQANAPGKPGDMDQVSMQFSKDEQAGAGAGVVMMSNQEMPTDNSQPGFGAGGGASTKSGGGKMSALEEALRRETVEASTDNSGQNVAADVRRKTEHSQASATFTHTASGTFDRSLAAAPPDVPEGRRASVQSYFIRKP